MVAHHTDSAHWEQASSADGGVTWETNWIADFRRAPGSFATA